MTRDDNYWATDAAAAFMRARLDELHATATAAKASLSGRWHADSEGNLQDRDTGENAAHIIINDPATVLASVAADRMLLDAYYQAGSIAQPDPAESGYLDGIAHAIRCRATAWAKHPGYREEWRP